MADEEHDAQLAARARRLEWTLDDYATKRREGARHDARAVGLSDAAVTLFATLVGMQTAEGGVGLLASVLALVVALAGKVRLAGVLASRQVEQANRDALAHEVRAEIRRVERKL